MRANERLLRESEAARYLGVSRSFLAQSRMDGQRENRTPAPPFIKMGKMVRYDIDDLDAWISAHKKHIHSTNDAGLSQ